MNQNPKQQAMLAEHRPAPNEHVVELKRFLRQRDYEESDPTPLEEAIVEAIAALEAVDRAKHYVPSGDVIPLADRVNALRRQSNAVAAFMCLNPADGERQAEQARRLLRINDGDEIGVEPDEFPSAGNTRAALRNVFVVDPPLPAADPKEK